jgi:hypothetical protein
MTRYYKKVISMMTRAIEDELAYRIHSAIGENMTMQGEGLSEETRKLRPDLNFVLVSMRGKEFMVMNDISCPYGNIWPREDTLQKVCIDKFEKSSKLVQEVKAERDIPVEIISFIVWSMGAVHEQSLKDFSLLFMCGEKEMKRIGRKLSEAVIAGPLEIWRRCARNVMHGEKPQIRQMYTQEALMAGDE